MATGANGPVGRVGRAGRTAGSAAEHVGPARGSGDAPDRCRPEQGASTDEGHGDPYQLPSASSSMPSATAIWAAADTMRTLPTVGLRATSSPRISSGVTPASRAKAT